MKRIVLAVVGIVFIALAVGYALLALPPTSDSFKVHDFSDTAAYTYGLSWTQAFHPTRTGNLTGVSVLIRATGQSGSRGTASTQWTVTCDGAETGWGTATLDLSAEDPDYMWYTLPRMGQLKQPFAAGQDCSLYITTGTPTNGLTIRTAKALGGEKSLVIWANAPAPGTPTPPPTTTTQTSTPSTEATAPGAEPPSTPGPETPLIVLVVVVAFLIVAIRRRG